jgi:hypothetical protein
MAKKISLEDSIYTYIVDFGNLASERSVGNEDSGSNLYGSHETLVRASDHGVVTEMGVISANFQSLICCKFNGLSILQHTSSNLWALGIEHNSAVLTWSLSESLSQVVEGLAMGSVITVTEIKSSNIHSSVEHFN